MLEKLFTYSSALRRHKNAPFLEAREQYLAHKEEEGCARATLVRVARELYWVAKQYQSDEAGTRKITRDEIHRAADKWAENQRRSGRALGHKWSYYLFSHVATQWFRFLGRLHEPLVEPAWYMSLIDEFAGFMEHERGLSQRTIKNRCWHIEQFLRWYNPAKSRALSSVEILDIDKFLQVYGSARWSRVSIAASAKALRAFFRYAGMRNWCNPRIGDSIQGPRLFAQEQLPLGTSWQDVKAIIDSTETQAAFDIRDRAILILFSIYGLRCAEVSNLKLDDINWEQNQIKVRREKQSQLQIYPLTATLGNALIPYLKSVRPACRFRKVFMTLKAPIKPLSNGALYHIVSKRIGKLGIRTAHRGPHALRHACATHLVSKGFSLKEIGDHLGHRSASATRIYAKVDLPNLRSVAAFNFGGVL